MGQAQWKCPVQAIKWTCATRGPFHRPVFASLRLAEVTDVSVMCRIHKPQTYIDGNLDVLQEKGEFFLRLPVVRNSDYNLNKWICANIDLQLIQMET